MIEWVSLSQGGKVNAVDPATNTLITDFGNHTAQVANVIPPQRAGRIADDRGRDRQHRLVRDRSGHVRIQIGAEHPRHRRCLPRRRHAQIRVLGQCAGQGLRGRDCHAAIRRIARHAEADQYLLQPGGPGLWHLGRRRLPAEERRCWPTSRAPAASARRMRHASSARARPTMRNPGFRPSRRKSLARRTHRMSGPILAGALFALPGFAAAQDLRSYAVVGDAIPESLTGMRRRRGARARARRRTFQHLHPLPQRPISRTEVPGRPGA